MNQHDAVREVARIPEHAGAAACFAAPVTAGDRVVIPVADTQYGFGFGWGGGTGPEGEQGGGGGGGGGARSRGIAVIEVAPTGVTVIPIEDRTAIRLAAIAFASAGAALMARTLLKLIRG